MPFVIKKMYVEKKQRAFLFFIKELNYTQKEAQRFIARGRLLINGEVMDKSSQKIQGEIEYIYFEPITRGLNVHVEYDQFVVFDKPSGVLIHPQNKNTPYSLIDELKYQYGRDANIAHRIDQETSGLVLCSKNKNSERDIKMMFEHRDMKKKYLAMVHGELKDDISIEAPLLRKEDESAIVRMVVKVHVDGKSSKTDIKPLKYFADKDITLVECSPLTGRQHQIRVHLFHVKHPIVGDPIYGQSEKDIVRFLDKELSIEDRINLSGASRLLLHANELEFDLYNEKFHIKSDVDFEKICFESMSI
ncbi:MAG: RluA family pseudouridine synthase [Sulfurimonas sp.]|uniref:RluA family pseudouridine synthase n=1 Tax=Sulfurimonas sp. TaxID=2022749 RepID=UPI00260EDEC5|nr:RluA family pseudouridine synthase [Sulfurimonas sp.]MCW8896279.1 RluA family pseudouridine synthase [Sulfurimonas sp.]MCW8954422.1 RluA family pseudouridine synthase [Sulfurimonas sp.]MCW9068059.1 RluA family pseudouridine synthase [Sulfurimonas sp.]